MKQQLFPLLYFSFISFQKINIIPKEKGCFFVITKKQLIQFLWYLVGFRSLINGKIPWMLAFLASVYEPDIHIVSIRIYPKLPGVYKFLLFSAASAAVVHPNAAAFSWYCSHAAPLLREWFSECFFLTVHILLPMQLMYDRSGTFHKFGNFFPAEPFLYPFGFPRLVSLYLECILLSHLHIAE